MTRRPLLLQLLLGLPLILFSPLFISNPLIHAFGFGGGCGCPCMPQPCIPQPPPIALPSLCLPQISLCPPPSCGCCGRKKRSVLQLKSGSTGGINDGTKHCNDPQIRRIILKNLVVGDLAGTKVAIHSELRAKLGGDYIVLCSPSPTLSFAADSTGQYCVEGHNALGCAVFQI